MATRKTAQSMATAVALQALVAAVLASCSTAPTVVYLTAEREGGTEISTTFGMDAGGPTKDCGAREAALCGVGGSCGSSADCATHLCVTSKCQNVAATCDDATKDGTETDVDCGGSACPPCANGKTCDVVADCTSGLCLMSTCHEPTPTDGVPDDSETDVDCGGALNDDGTMNTASDGAPACVAGKKCGLDSDCFDGVCAVSLGGAQLTCQSPSATDGVKNGDETGVDCGGALDGAGKPVPGSDGAPPCAAGQMCKVADDCASTVCTGGLCIAASPDDNVKNGGETAVDCGGGTSSGSDGAAACAAGKSCVVKADCQSDICTMGVCAAPSATDNVQNGGESDVDCGGTTTDSAPRCGDEKHCGADGDCLSGFCSLLHGTCVDGQSCKGIVTPAQILDITKAGYLDDNMTPHDAVGVPDANGAGQSAGLDTCGKGESTDPIAMQAHESCCRSLLLPGSTTTRLDKYEVTAGRIRQFAESLPIPYDLRDWAQTQIASGTPAGVRLAAQITTGAGGTTNMVALMPPSADAVPLSAVIQFGATVIDPAQLEQGCFTGSASGEAAGGGSVYWWDASHQLEVSDATSPPRAFTQDYYDIKPMNCGTYWVYAAFCAWDGGRLPTQAEVNAAYSAAQYPWGPTFLPAPVLNSDYVNVAAGGTNPNTGQTVVAGATTIPIINQYLAANGILGGAPAVTVNWLNGSSSNDGGDFYEYPGSNEGAPNTISTSLDTSPNIAAPGRFYLDQTSLKSASFAGNEGWQDLGANMMEWMGNTTAGTATLCDCSGYTQVSAANTACTCNMKNGALIPGTALGTAPTAGGSWEGHSSFNPADAAHFSSHTYDYPLWAQYGKIGLRCARDAEPAR